MRVVSLFSGIGGFELGIKNSNLNAEIVFSSEIDKYATISYLSNFKDNNLNGDITKISEKNIPEHDFLVAGFPCQAFSIAGKQKGFNDIRGTLFFDIIRILKEKKPKYFLLENVKNLISHNNSETFKCIINELNSIGYVIDFTIINSIEAGLPQNRERIYIIGILDIKSNKVEYDKRSKKISLLKKNINYLGIDFFNSLNFNNEQKYIKDIIDEENNDKYLIKNNNIFEFLKSNMLEEETIYKNKIIKLFDLPKDICNDLERQRRVYSIYGISPTVLARSDSAKIYIKNSKNICIRKLNPKECFRIQGFDDKFIDNIVENPLISTTQQYKQAGNAVSPPVVTGIINHFVNFINQINSKEKFKFIDLFCGLGGFRIAFEKLGGKCVFSSDIDSSVQKTYALNFGELPKGDITKISSDNIPNHDILCAGFPCQAFSIAGKRLGFEDIRGTLFFEIARILNDKKPKAFILENVKGIINHDSGKTLDIIIKTLDEIGYNLKYDILNAKDYNVPQNRERWYCVGILKESGIDINDYKFPAKEELKIKLLDIIEKNIDTNDYNITSICENNIKTFINKKNIDIKASTLAYDIRASRCRFVIDEISNCLTAKMGTGGNNIAVVIQQNRKLTELECLKIMGFPDNYKIGRGYQAYKQIGNSVVVPIILKLAEELIKLCKF